MKTYTALYAENVPHLGCVDFQTEDALDAVDKVRRINFEQVTTNTDWNNTVFRRIVEITDEDENIVAEFIPLGALPVRFNQRQVRNLPGAMSFRPTSRKRFPQRRPSFRRTTTASPPLSRAKEVLPYPKHCSKTLPCINPQR
jgi:hypothetical protein